MTALLNCMGHNADRKLGTLAIDAAKELVARQKAEQDGAASAGAGSTSGVAGDKVGDRQT